MLTKIHLKLQKVNLQGIIKILNDQQLNELNSERVVTAIQIRSIRVHLINIVLI